MPILSSLKLEKDVSRLSFSVIIPVFNNWDEAEVAISSCLAQAYSQFEIIVVDDASSRISQTVLEHASVAGVKVVRNQVNMGPFFSRLKGVSEASGDYIIFLDADDSLANEFMPNLNESLTDESADIVATGVIHGAGEPFGPLYGMKLFNYQFKVRTTDDFSEWISYARINRLGTPGKVYSRRLVEKVVDLHGPLFASAQLRYAEDVYLFFLCCIHATKYGYSPASYYLYTPGERSVTRARDSELQAVKKLLILEVLFLIKTSATVAPRSGVIVSDFFRSQLLVDYHLLDRWNSRSRWDGIYPKSLWRAYLVRGSARDLARVVIGGMVYLFLGKKR